MWKVRAQSFLGLRYREHGEQTVTVCVLMHLLQPNKAEGVQEVIITGVPEQGVGGAACNSAGDPGGGEGCG